MKFDLYTLVARICPAVVNSVPFLLFFDHLSDSHLGTLFAQLASFKLVTGVSTSFLIILSLSLISRSLSKLIESSYFKDELKMPTTKMLLLGDDTFSLEYKQKLRRKIFANFGIKLLDQVEEGKNRLEARKRIAEAVSFIRESVKGGRLVLQYNIEYGFLRNLIGGALISFPFCVFCVVFFSIEGNSTGWILSLVGLVFFSSLLLFSRQILTKMGSLYAKRLFQEFLA